MPEQPPQDRPAGSRGPAAGAVTYLDQALWRQLVEAEGAPEFCRAWLGLLCRMIDGVDRGVVALGPPESGPFAPVAAWPAEGRDFASLAPVIERVLKDRKGVVTRNDAEGELASPDHLRFLLAYPVWGDGKLHGAAAVEIGPRSQLQLQSAMRQLQWGIPWIENRILRKESVPEVRTRERLATALDLAAVALQEERFQAAATAFVTELATRLPVDRASVGFVKGGRVAVRAVSHSARFGEQMNLIRRIGAAMDESVDQLARLAWPAGEEGDRHVLAAHEELATGDGSGAVLTVPFVDKSGKGYGALTVERAGSVPLDAAAADLCECVASLVGPILEEKRRNDRLVVFKVGESLGRQAAKFVGPRHVAAKLIAGGLVLLAVFFAVAKGEYRVTADTALRGEIQRAVTAPYPGYISGARARAGDVVRLGQILCNLDDRDMSIERLKWSSQREQHEHEYRKAMAKGDTGAAMAFLEQVRQAGAHLELLDKQLSRANIVAPFDGIVVTGDLSQSLGAPVERGQLLFEIAPLDAYRVVLQVDERDIGQIRPGQRGELVLNALPGDRHGFSVQKITPVSLAKEGRNFFTVEAKLDTVTDRLRPGMEGTGKIAAGRRNLFWIYAHDLIDWVRLWVWSWWP